jgi:DNA-binding protein WhiA
MASCARRIGLAPLVRESRGQAGVVLRDPADVGTLLTRIGADETRIAWERRCGQHTMYATAARLANLDEANMRRSARAAAITCERVEQALEILGDTAPEHLASTGRLRMQHRSASLEELGQLADPPMTKDAVAGRLRRLLALGEEQRGATYLAAGRTVLTV